MSELTIKDKVTETPPTDYGKSWEYCMYFLEWASNNHYNLTFSCGRRISNLSKYTNKFKKLDTGVSLCSCGRIASQGELA